MQVGQISTNATQPDTSATPNVQSDPELQAKLSTLTKLKGITASLLTEIDEKLKYDPLLVTSVAKLKSMNISCGDSLRCRLGLNRRTEEATLVGANCTMSAPGFHEYLRMLAALVVQHESMPRARMWFEAFLYRAAVMQNPKTPLVLLAPEGISVVPIAVLSRETETEGLYITTPLQYQEYTAYLASEESGAPADCDNAKSIVQLFLVHVAEKLELNDYMPHVIMSLYESVTKPKSKVYMRGVLSNGFEFSFVELRLNPDGQGATYRRSDKFLFKLHSHWLTPYEEFPARAIHLISGMLGSWIANSKEPVSAEGDDWFF
ncbi:hypothetical protein BXZ70DRAFT_229356 [Cristinia sonorae]|uniref:Uncharacterized protein n=1 Tax=Cristinia sonorae TaxID=1940300 RepID=A0A8K0XP18_9AGAR|nr:hypothetical protein BXZ70DRAFT_229356 [Cristinia sonorae]